MRKIHSSITLFIVSGSFLFCGCQSVQTQAIATPEVLAEFEFSGDSKFILLPVEFQGGEYQFALDTGSSNIVFDDSFKDKLGKRFLWPKTASGAHGKKFKVEMFRALSAPAIYLGPLRLKKHGLIAVCDLDQLLPKQEKTFDGILGMKFLKKYIVQIDFDNKKVTFLKGKKDNDLFSFLKPKENKHPEWGEPIPLKTKLFSELRYAKGSLLNKFTSDFMIDSSWCSLDALQSSSFKRVESELSFGPRPENASKNSGMSSNVNIKVIERFSVGTFEYENIFFQQNNKSILGLFFLSRHLVTFDFPNNVMYLKKGKNFDKQLSFTIRLEGTNCDFDVSDGKILVSNVDPNGVAYKKGIRQNDIVLKLQINDLVLSSFSTIEVMEFLSAPSSQEAGLLTFTIKRGDDIIDVSFEKSDVEGEAEKNGTD